MTSLTVVDREQQEHSMTGEIGLSVMEIIRDGGIDEMSAMCGGCCSCATCHVFVDPAWMDLAGLPSEDEGDLLESSEHRTGFSRLSCQITMSTALDGLRVTIAPED